MSTKEEKVKQVWRNVEAATYPPGPYRDGRSVGSPSFKHVDIHLRLQCGHYRTVRRRVGVQTYDHGMKMLPDSYIVEAPPYRVRCPECETKAR